MESPSTKPGDCESAQRRYPPASSVRILVVEDDAPLLSAVLSALQKYGYAANGAATCSEARRLFRDHIPNLLLLDISLPDGTGWDLLKEFRTCIRGKVLPAVMASSATVTRRQLREAKVEQFVAKPFSFAELLRAIGRALGTANP